MHGPAILARHLNQLGPPDKYGNRWQYHPRSDRHGQVGCWGVGFDLLAQSSLMQHHALAGKIVIGVNHVMRDFATGREKVLDLVVARPAEPVPPSPPTFKGLAQRNAITLTPSESTELAALPDIPIAPVGAVLTALEAKACMTAHVKSLPRLYDELNSSHLCVHGASTHALAIAYVQVNAAVSFVSPIINSPRLAEGLSVRATAHNQPTDAERVIQKVTEIPRRSGHSGVGFDAIGISVLDLPNDGSPVRLVTGPPAPPLGSNFDYDSMIVRMANEYDATFSHI